MYGLSNRNWRCTLADDLNDLVNPLGVSSSVIATSYIISINVLSSIGKWSLIILVVVIDYLVYQIRQLSHSILRMWDVQFGVPEHTDHTVPIAVSCKYAVLIPACDGIS